MKYCTPLLLFVLAMASLISAMFYYRKYEYPDIDNQQDCMKKSQNCGNDCCAIWRDGICRKGHVTGMVCKSKGHVGPLLVTLLGIVFLCAFVVTFIMYLK